MKLTVLYDSGSSVSARLYDAANGNYYMSGEVWSGEAQADLSALSETTLQDASFSRYYGEETGRPNGDYLVEYVNTITDEVVAEEPFKRTEGFQKGVAVTGFQFLMVDVSNNPATGLTVSGTISKDGGSFNAIVGSVTEIANGMYKINLSESEMDADMLTLRFTASGGKDRLITLTTND